VPVLPEDFDNVVPTAESITDAVLVTEPQWHAAAATAVTYRVKITTAPDDAMDKPPPVAVPQYFPGLFFAYLTVLFWAIIDKDITFQAEHYLHVYRVIAVVVDLTTGTGSDHQAPGGIDYLSGFIGCQYIGILQVITPGVGHPANQPTEQGYPGHPCPEHVEPEHGLAMSTIKPECMMHDKYLTSIQSTGNRSRLQPATQAVLTIAWL
jgi:hypothetical protein